MRIYLIGMMGSGKTTIGKKLAKKLSFEFFDLDDLIEKKTNISVSDYFRNYGEENFRILEQETLRETFKFDNAVISTGGGVPCYFSNIEEINKYGLSIYLKADINLLISRLKDATYERPLLKNKNSEELKDYLFQLIAQRENYYQKAKIVVDSRDLSVQKLVSFIQENFY